MATRVQSRHSASERVPFLLNTPLVVVSLWLMFVESVVERHMCTRINLRRTYVLGRYLYSDVKVVSMICSSAQQFHMCLFQGCTRRVSSSTPAWRTILLGNPCRCFGSTADSDVCRRGSMGMCERALVLDIPSAGG